MLTGITNAMVWDAPRIETVLPSFLEWIRRLCAGRPQRAVRRRVPAAACARHGMRWPKPAVSTPCSWPAGCWPGRGAERPVGCARPADEGDGTAGPPRAARRPGHCRRAARPDRANRHAGVHSLPELLEASRDLSPARRRKRHLADPLPNGPGVYLFRGRRDEVLYVGTAGNLAAGPLRISLPRRSANGSPRWCRLAERVDHVVCAHPLEANVREQRLIAAHQPPYNRRSRHRTRCAGWY